MKSSKAQIHFRVYRLPQLRFEDQRLTSFSGLVLLQVLFRRLELRERLRSCFTHLSKGLVVGLPKVTMLLIVHVMLGYRRLRELDYYRDDPLVARTLGLRWLPHVSTVSRGLARMDDRAVANLQALNRSMVADRIQQEQLARVTFDFDGSVIASNRFAEGLAVGYNNKKKGQRSYYPLFCGVAQTAQVLDVLHRAGNVHDSNGAAGFMRSCIAEVRQRVPRALVECRVDSAFFSDKTATLLDQQGVEFSMSVPFERFPELKGIIEARQRWRRLDEQWDYFQIDWAPKSWPLVDRVLILRHRVPIQDKEPVQLDLFRPHQQGYEFKAVLTNKSGRAKGILLFHNGRSSQENGFGQLKQQCQMDYVPTKRLSGNQVYFLCALLAHNLYRELQMRVEVPRRNTTARRAALWLFAEAATLRQHLIHRAGRLTRPHGRLRLTLSGNELTRKEYLEHLRALKKSA